MEDLTHTWERQYTTLDFISACELGDDPLEALDVRALKWVAENHANEAHNGYDWHAIMIHAYDAVRGAWWTD